MRKFKLVAKYPGFEKPGIIVKEVKGYGYLDERLNGDSCIMHPNAFLPKSHVEDHPEFWEEVIVEKVEKLFTTEDGVDIYEGEECWAGYVEEGIDSFYPSNWAGTGKNMKYFSTKGAAEEYINKHNITFTLEEVVKIVNNWSMSRIDEGDILRFYEKIKK